MLQLYPAIDLRGGKCVRLVKGDFEQETVFGDNPADMARRWEAAGATFLHVVDLDGAQAGHPVHVNTIKNILASVITPIEVGGGIRTLEDVALWLELGVRRIILGSVAVRNPGLVREACRRWPGRVVVGLDVSKGKVMTQGWLTRSDMGAATMASRMRVCGVSEVVYTDISRDGTLGGIDAAGAVSLARASGLRVVISGGVRSLDDVRLAKAHVTDGVSGLILGKALYTGDLDLGAALDVAAGKRE